MPIVPLLARGFGGFGHGFGLLVRVRAAHGLATPEGHIVLPRGRERRGVGAILPVKRLLRRLGEAFGLLAPGVSSEQLVKPARAGGGMRLLRQFAVQPGEVREQQARIVVDLVTGDLAVIGNGHLHSIERASGEHGFGISARVDHGRIPERGEIRILPPLAISGLMTDPNPRRRRAHIALQREVIEEANAPLQREHSGVPGRAEGIVGRVFGWDAEVAGERDPAAAGGVGGSRRAFATLAVRATQSLLTMTLRDGTSRCLLRVSELMSGLRTGPLILRR
jgi:hypothetical protein